MERLSASLSLSISFIMIYLMTGLVGGRDIKIWSRRSGAFRSDRIESNRTQMSDANDKYSPADTTDDAIIERMKTCHNVTPTKSIYIFIYVSSACVCVSYKHLQQKQQQQQHLNKYVGQGRLVG